MNFRPFHGFLPRMKRNFMNFRANAGLRQRNGGHGPAAKPIKKAAGYAQHPDGLESLSPRAYDRRMTSVTTSATTVMLSASTL